MKPRQSTARIPLFLLMAATVSILACSFFARSTGPLASQSTPSAAPGDSGGLVPSVAPSGLATAAADETPTAQPTPEAGFDLSQAGLPPGFAIYPGAHDFTGSPGVMLIYTADADVRATSEFYDEKMRADGWTGFSTGGAGVGECDDCGPGPTKTPGPGPTATPEGWMDQNTQVWMKGSQQIVIQFTAESGGTTRVMVGLTAQ